MQYPFDLGGVLAEPNHSLPCVNYEEPNGLNCWNGLVLVGEAPGKDEVRLGRPFVGRSGQLLNEMLLEAGIKREDSIVANVFRFQPPGNKVDHFFLSRRAAAGQGVSLAEEWGRFGSSWCRADFAKEIKHLKLRLEKYRKRAKSRMILVALGRTPFWALTGENGLLTKVGQRFNCRLLPAVPVIPTFHPSFILRGNWDKRPEWLKHFVAAAHYVAGK